MTTTQQGHAGTALRAVREGVGLTVGQVAQRAGCSAGHLGRIERGERRLSERGALYWPLLRVLATAISEGAAA